MEQDLTDELPGDVPPAPPVPPAAKPLANRQAFHLAPEIDPAPRRSGGVIVWMLAMIIVLLVASVLVPRMVEEIQYSLARGQQRADHELAGELLQTASLGDV